MEPLADIRTWKANAPRCAVCAIGFVRFKDSLCKYRANPNDYYNEFYYSDVDAEIQNNFLCVQCLVRKELYNKTSSLLGRSLRQTLNRPWPFVERRAPAFNEATMLIHQQLQNQKDNSQQKQLSDLPSDTERPLAGMELIENLSINTGIMSDITPMHSVVYFNRPPSPSEFLARSPIMSKKLHRIDAFEDHHNRNKNNYISYSFDSDDSGVDLGRGITPQTKHVRGKSRKGLRIDAAGIAKQELSQYESNVISAALVEFEGTGENLSLNSMVSSLSNSAFEGVDSVVSMSTISTITLNNPVKQPKELTLLPFLVAKGHYEEVERVVRIVLGKRAIDEGEGMLQLLRTFSFLGEMYKCMGLWPLSLAIYMDSVDISASLLGYSDFLTLQTVQKVSSVFRKMKLKHVSIDYINALCYSIEENSLKTLKNDTIRTIKEYEK